MENEIIESILPGQVPENGNSEPRSLPNSKILVGRNPLLSNLRGVAFALALSVAGSGGVRDGINMENIAVPTIASTSLNDRGHQNDLYVSPESNEANVYRDRIQQEYLRISDSLNERYGIQISFTFDRSHMSEYGGSEIQDPARLLKITRRISDVLSIYPSEMVRALNLKVIPIDDYDLWDSEVESVGSYNGSEFFANANTSGINFARIFHHEFAHRLFDVYGDPEVEAEILALYPDCDPYVDRISEINDDTHCHIGSFARDYGKYGPAEDLATIAEALFDPVSADQLVNRANSDSEDGRLLKKKIEIVKEVYYKVSEGILDDDFWQKIEKGNLPPEYYSLNEGTDNTPISINIPKNKLDLDLAKVVFPDIQLEAIDGEIDSPETVVAMHFALVAKLRDSMPSSLHTLIYEAYDLGHDSENANLNAVLELVGNGVTRFDEDIIQRFSTLEPVSLRREVISDLNTLNDEDLARVQRWLNSTERFEIFRVTLLKDSTRPRVLAGMLQNYAIYSEYGNLSPDEYFETVSSTLLTNPTQMDPKIPSSYSSWLKSAEIYAPNEIREALMRPDNYMLLYELTKRELPDTTPAQEMLRFYRSFPFWRVIYPDRDPQEFIDTAILLENPKQMFTSMLIIYDLVRQNVPYTEWESTADRLSSVYNKITTPRYFDAEKGEIIDTSKTIETNSLIDREYSALLYQIVERMSKNQAIFIAAEDLNTLVGFATGDLERYADEYRELLYKLFEDESFRELSQSNFNDVVVIIQRALQELPEEHDLDPAQTAMRALRNIVDSKNPAVFAKIQRVLGDKEVQESPIYDLLSNLVKESDLDASESIGFKIDQIINTYRDFPNDEMRSRFKSQMEKIISRVGMQKALGFIGSMIPSGEFSPEAPALLLDLIDIELATYDLYSFNGFPQDAYYDIPPDEFSGSYTGYDFSKIFELPSDAIPYDMVFEIKIQQELIPLLETRILDDDWVGSFRNIYQVLKESNLPPLLLYSFCERVFDESEPEGVIMDIWVLQALQTAIESGSLSSEDFSYFVTRRLSGNPFPEEAFNALTPALSKVMLNFASDSQDFDERISDLKKAVSLFEEYDVPSTYGNISELSSIAFTNNFFLRYFEELRGSFTKEEIGAILSLMEVSVSGLDSNIYGTDVINISDSQKAILSNIIIGQALKSGIQEIRFDPELLRIAYYIGVPRDSLFRDDFDLNSIIARGEEYREMIRKGFSIEKMLAEVDNTGEPLNFEIDRG